MKAEGMRTPKPVLSMASATETGCQEMMYPRGLQVGRILSEEILISHH